MTRNLNQNGTLNSYTICGNELIPGDRFGYKVVAIIWSEKFWCAYRGHTDWEDERVQREGDTLPYNVAKYLFPTIAEAIENYD